MNKKSKELRLKIIEVFGSQSAFAKAYGMEETQLSARLNGKVDWKMPEVVRACDMLGIDFGEVNLYFLP